jgi:hypothetical protein
MDGDAVITDRLRRLHQDQRGLSTVEMIITMALTGIILGAIFSVYLLLYRVQTTWQDKSQARATGLVAEQSLQRDLERYRVTSTGRDQLVLGAASIAGDSSQPPSKFSVEYKRDSAKRVKRNVMRGGTLVSSTVIAHGIRAFEAWCGNAGPPSGLWVDPPLKVTTRNDPTCGALNVALRVDTL